MNLEVLLRFYNDLVDFDSSRPVVVTYHQGSLLFRQVNRMVATPYFDNYYFHAKLKLGVLLPYDFAELLETLKNLVQDGGLRSGDLNTSLKNFGFNVYGLQHGMEGPQIKYEINLVSISRSWLAKLALKRSDTESRLLLKMINNENRRKRNKSI